MWFLAFISLLFFIVLMLLFVSNMPHHRSLNDLRDNNRDDNRNEAPQCNGCAKPAQRPCNTCGVPKSQCNCPKRNCAFC